jgi:nucleoside 2-deoxyribosyltransferase
VLARGVYGLAFMKLYLAGPDVFLPEAPARAAVKKARVVAAGHHPLFPLDAALDVDVARDPGPVAAAAIFAANRALLDAADAVLANLTPFRGPSADAGTVWEVGYAAGRGKKIYGYSNVLTPFAERTRAGLPPGGDGLEVEDFGLPSDNLMIHFALAGYFAHAAPAEALWTDLTSFDAALAAIG